MSYKIETHDYGVRLKNTKKFLTQGNRVRELSECPVGVIFVIKARKCSCIPCDFFANVYVESSFMRF